MRDDLRVGLGDEHVALALQLVLQIEVVLDDAVVNDDDAARAVPMRVGVLLSRPAVRCPARVPDAVGAGERMGVNHRFQVRELAGAAAQVDGAVVHDGHARRVVASVLELPEAVDENRDDVFRADVTDNATHNSAPRPSACLDPAVDVALLSRADREGARGNILADRRAGADVRIASDGDRRNELRVTADERAVLDRRDLLL